MTDLFCSDFSFSFVSIHSSCFGWGTVVLRSLPPPPPPLLCSDLQMCFKGKF